MGINDRCAAGACNNAQKYKEEYVIKPHISAFNGSLELQFWKCTDPKLYPKWTFSCNRKDFKFGKNHVVCSNHFEYGRPTNVSKIPTLYLKGYSGGACGDDQQSISRPKRKAPMDRPAIPKTLGKKKKSESENTVIESTTTSILNSPSSTIDFESTANSSILNSTVSLDKPIKNSFAWIDIKEKNRIIKLYRGCPSNKLFMFIVDHVRPKHAKLQYFKSASSVTGDKQYQISPVKLYCQRKPGPSRRLSLEDEILMTLMRIRLDAPDEDLAFRFGISMSHASNIITTFIVFLGLELKPLIYWPTPDETLAYQHPHFSGTFNKVEGIGDCTEQWIQHSKNVDAQYQTYSTYKSHNTLKKLIFCTKSGSISYISEAYGGSASDRFITNDTNVAAKFTPGFIPLFDKGFNVQDLFLAQQVKCVLPPFVSSKRKFTRSEVYHGKRIARARIHIERVMGRLKEFRLLNNIIPISMLDLCDHIWTIAGAITNIQPPLVK